MAVSRILPFAFDEDLWHSLSELQRQSRQLSFVDPGLSVGMREAFRLDNPIMTDKDGNKKFHLDFDLRQFKPEEIQLTTKDNVLSVHAKHEERSEGRTSYREYRREYALPPGVSPESLSSKLRHDGVLSIEAPLQQRQDVLIPITHQ